MISNLIVMFRRFNPLLAIALALFAIAATTIPARASSSISVTSDPVQGNPYEVQENQDSTLTYTLTYSVGANSEGVTPSLNSITLTFSVNNGGTIQESGSSTWTETLTQNLTSPMNVSCEASGPANGNYSVTCEATLNLSDGTTASGGPASDAFLVAQMTVNVSGPPYVIIDNSNPYDNSPVDSTYTASVQGAPDPTNIVYEWTVSSNINDLSGYSGAPDSIEVDGAGPESPGNIVCAAYSNGTNQSGSKQVTVQDEFVVAETSSNVPGEMSSPLLAQFGPYNNGTQTVVSVQVNQSQQVSQTVSVGFTASAGAADGVIEANFGLSSSTSATISGTISVQTTLTIPPSTSETIQEFPATDTDSGTYQIWGTSGITSSGKWVYVQLAPGPMPTAQTILSAPYTGS